MTWLDGKDKANVVNDVYQRSRPKAINPADALVAQNVSRIYARHPYIPAGVVLGLAESNADMELVDAIAEKAVKQTADKYVEESKTRQKYQVREGFGLDNVAKGIFAGGRWILGNTIGRVAPAKALTKYASATLDTGGQIIQNTGALVTGNAKDALKGIVYNRGDFQDIFKAENYIGPGSALNPTVNDLQGVKDFFESTAIGALVSGDDSGSGFTLGGEAEENRAAAARRFRGEINGHTWTIGRGSASAVFTPGSQPYSYLSGVIDAGVMLVGDPTTFAFGGETRAAASFIKKAEDVAIKEALASGATASIAKKAGKVAAKAAKESEATRQAAHLGTGTLIPALVTAEGISAARKLAEGNAGLLSASEQHAIDTEGFFHFMDKTVKGQAIVKSLVDETDELKIMEGMGWKVTPEQARELANAPDVDTVRGLFAEQAVRLSEETTQGFVPFATRTGQLPYATTVRIPGAQLMQNSKWLAGTPKEFLLVNGSPQERSGAIKNVVNWLRTMQVDPFTGDGKVMMKTAFDAFGAEGTKVDAKKLHQLFIGNPDTGELGLIMQVLKNKKVPDDVIQDVMARYTDNIEKIRSYSRNSIGEVDDGGFVKSVLATMPKDEVNALLEFFAKPLLDDLPPNATQAQIDAVIASIDPGDLHLFGAAALSDMVDHVMVLPDVRRIRNLTTNNPFMHLHGGEQKATAVIDWLQTEWRGYALSTIGFMMRNSMDAQLRIVMAGISTERPIDYILMAMRMQGMGMLGPEGSAFKDAAKQVAEGTAPDLVEMVRFMGADTHQWLNKPDQALSRLVKNNDIAILPIENQAYRLGLHSELRRVYSDPLLRLGVQVSHLPMPRQIEIMSAFIDSGKPAAKGIRKTLERYAQEGYKVGMPKAGYKTTMLKYPQATSMSTEDLLGLWHEHLGSSQIDNLIFPGNDELRIVAGHGRVPIGVSDQIGETEARAMHHSGNRPKIGEIITKDAGVDADGNQILWEYIVYETSYAAGVGRQYKIIRVNKAFPFGAEHGSKSTIALYEKQIAEHGKSVMEGRGAKLPLQTTMAAKVETPKLTGVDKVAKAGLDVLHFLPNKFFEVLVPKGVELAEKSPPWRMTYYNTFAENANLLSPDEAALLLDDITENARRALPEHFARNPEGAVARYVGGNNNLSNIKARVKEALAGDGVGTREQLQTYASGRASIDVRELLFDASQKSNIADAMRIVAPFGGAWAEVFGNYAKKMVEDPRRIRKVQRNIRGAMGFDPDADGHGIIWVDPITKQKMFTFPLSNLGIKAITTITSALGFGVKIDGASLSAPLKQLSAGLAVVPGAGPAVQMAYSFLANSNEVFDSELLRKLLTPYGDQGVVGLAPGWVVKVVSSFANDPEKLDTLLASVYGDTFAYLTTTGEYDLTSKDDVLRMKQDAKDTARILTLVRAASQAIGPTSGRIDYKVDLEKGDTYANNLIAAFHDLENDNYDTAVGKFIEIFGEEALIYMGAKTKSNQDFGGIESTTEFGRWQKKNSDLISAHKSVAGYLGPSSSNFGFEALNSQLGHGQKFRVTPEDRLEAAQKKVGSALYVHYRKDFPLDPTSRQAQLLRNKRVEINKKYPGFPVSAEFPAGEFKNFVRDLKKLVVDKKVVKDPTAMAIKKYLDARDVQLNLLKSRGFNSLDGSGIYRAESRDKLLKLGNKIAEDVPNFERIWSRELKQEAEK